MVVVVVEMVKELVVVGCFGDGGIGVYEMGVRDGVWRVVGE